MPVFKGPSEQQRTNVNINLADRVGFEPTEPLQARRISSAVPSTTRPPVRRRRYWSGWGLASQIPGKCGILRAPEEVLARHRPLPIAVIAALTAAVGLAQIATCSRPAMAADAAPPTGLRQDVIFPDYGPLARNSEILPRVLTPLTVAGLQREFARTGKTLSETSFDPAAEKFLVHVPAEKPPQGYGLMVFVPPWQKAQLPNGWGAGAGPVRRDIRHRRPVRQ